MTEFSRDLVYRPLAAVKIVVGPRNLFIFMPNAFSVRLIDKYIFDDQQPAAAPAPQIIQVPAPPMCACRCGQLSTSIITSFLKLF